MFNNSICGAQVFYITTVYPESVSKEEAKEEAKWQVLSEADKEYWDVAANVIMKLCTLEG